MKQLKEIIEGLKVNSKSKVHQNALIMDDDILNVNIESLDELRDVMEKYFEKKYVIAVTKIDQANTKWKTQHGGDYIVVDAHFSIRFFKNSIIVYNLQFAEHKDGYLLMQIIIKDYTGKMRPCRIHGGSTYNEFRPGDNLLEFIQTIVKHTKDNHPIDKDENITKLFTEIDDNIQKSRKP